MHLAAPIFRDGIGVFLSVPDGAVRIGESHDIARGWIHLPISTEAVSPLVLRSAMYVENQGILFLFAEAMRFDDKRVDFFAVHARDPHFFDGSRIIISG